MEKNDTKKIQLSQTEIQIQTKNFVHSKWSVFKDPTFLSPQMQRFEVKSCFQDFH